MNKIRDRILKAMRHAAPMELAAGNWVLVQDKAADNIFNIPDLINSPDNEQVIIEVDPDTLPGYFITAKHTKELKEILEEFLDISGDKLTESEIEEEISHEAEHGEAARLLGAESNFYYLEVHENIEEDMLGWRLGHCSRRLETTKLGLAVLNVYPKEPSDMDMQQLESLGYKSISQVAKLAEKSNLPVPLSANKKY